MLAMIGQPQPTVTVEPVPMAAARGAEKPSGVSPFTVFLLMGMLLTGAVGYAMGFERGIGSGFEKRKQTKTRRDWED